MRLHWDVLWQCPMCCSRSCAFILLSGAHLKLRAGTTSGHWALSSRCSALQMCFCQAIMLVSGGRLIVLGKRDKSLLFCISEVGKFWYLQLMLFYLNMSMWKYIAQQEALELRFISALPLCKGIWVQFLIEIGWNPWNNSHRWKKNPS